MQVYTYDQKLLAAGCDSYESGTAWCWYDRVGGKYDMSRVSMRAVDKACESSMERTDPFLMDIEAFNLEQDREKALLNLHAAARRWKSNQPHRQIGYYRLVPERNYWAPVLRQNYLDRWHVEKWQEACAKYREWQDRTTANARDLLPFVDFVVPSLYIFYAGQDAAWRVYADANLQEAIRVARGKPIYPILMPSIHPGDQAIAPATWQMMVEFVRAYAGIDGLMLHTGSGYTVDPLWREPVIARMSGDTD